MTGPLTELEEQLAAPGGAHVRDEALAELASIERRLRSNMAASLPRDEFPVAAALADAARAGQELLAGWPVETLAPGPVPNLQSPLTSHRSTPWS